MLVERADDVYALFDLAACLGGGASGDFTHVGLNSYKELLGSCGLIEYKAEGLNGARWDELFVTLNSAGSSAAAVDQFNHKKGTPALVA